MKRYLSIQVQRDSIYLSFALSTLYALYRISIELSLNHFWHAIRLIGIVVVFVPFLGLLIRAIFNEFMNGRIYAYTTGNMLPMPTGLFWSFTTSLDLVRFEERVLNQLERETRARSQARQEKRSEELHALFQDLLRKLDSEKSTEWMATWEQAGTLKEQRKVFSRLQKVVEPRQVIGGVVHDRRTKLLKYQPNLPNQEASNPSESRCRPKNRSLPEVRYINLKHVANQRLNVSELLPYKCDPVLSKQILLGLMNLGNEVSLMQGNYMPADALARKVRTSLRRLGIPFAPADYKTTLATLLDQGVIVSKPKTDEMCYSIAAKPKDGKSPQSREIIRRVAMVIQDVKAGRL